MEFVLLTKLLVTFHIIALAMRGTKDIIVPGLK